MARGTGKRIVIELNPELKKALYERLDRDYMTLKDWFTDGVEKYLGRRPDETLRGKVVRTPMGTGEVLKQLNDTLWVFIHDNVISTQVDDVEVVRG